MEMVSTVTTTETRWGVLLSRVTLGIEKRHGTKTSMGTAGAVMIGHAAVPGILVVAVIINSGVANMWMVEGRV